MRDLRDQDPRAGFRAALIAGDLRRMRECARALAEDRVDLLLGYDTLIEGIQQITRFDDWETANSLFLRLHKAQTVRPEIRWGLWLWQALAHLERGQLDVAKTAADTALTIVQRLDPASHGHTLAIRAAVGVLEGDLASGRSRLVEAARLCARDRAAAARLWLFWGQVMHAAGREQEALRALSQGAETLREAWASVPLARQALVARRVDDAAELLVPLVQLQDGDDEAGCLVGIVEDLRQGRVAVEVVSEYLWLTSQLLDDRSAQLVETLLDQEARSYPPLRQLFVWDLVRGGQFALAGHQLELLLQERSTPTTAMTARRTRVRVDELQNNWCLGVLEVAVVATLQIFGSTVPAEEDSGTELFWIRRVMASGDLSRAARELDCLEGSPVRHQRELLDAIVSGQVPLQIAKEYLWLQERPITEELLVQLRSFAEENRALPALLLAMARDLLADGFEEPARELLEQIDGATASASVLAGRRDAMARLGPVRAPAPAEASPLELGDFVNQRLIWPSVLDQRSLLFSGERQDLPDAMLEVATALRLRPGESPHRQGERGELLYVVEEGALHAARVRGQADDLGVVEAGGFLGELGTLYGLPNTATLTAVSETRISVIKREVLRTAAAQSGTAGLLIRALREMHRRSALGLCPICAEPDLEFLCELAQTEGRCRIFQRGERVSLAAGLPVGVLLTGIGRVVTTAQGITLGYLAPSDLVIDLAGKAVQVRAERMLSLAMLTVEDIEHLSREGQLALGFHLNRCRDALRAAEVMPDAALGAELAALPLGLREA